MVPLIVSVPLWADPVVRLLYGERYLAAAPAVMLIVVMSALCVLNLLNSYVLLSLQVVRFAIWITGAAAVLSVSLNLWLVPTHGFLAAALVAVLAEAFMLSVTFTLLQRRVGNIFDPYVWLAAGAGGALMALLLYGWQPPERWQGLVAGLLAYVAVARVSGLWRRNRRALTV
jgi:O-antigen/teichoic acid export membrane protein